jgi:hypothetical protein
VKTPQGGYEPKEIVVGASNEKEAEIRSGLQQGDQVVLNYKILEDERARANKPSLTEHLDASDEVKSTDWGKETSPSVALEKAGKAFDQGPGGKKEGKGRGMKDGKGKGGSGGFQMTPEMQKQRQEFDAKFKKASPAQRKEMLEQIPEDFREMARQRFKAQGIEIAD